MALTSTDDISVSNISAGIITATTFGGNPSFTGNVSIGGTLTYEDVTNIDAVGLITARQGIKIGTGVGVAASISVDGNMIVSGVTTLGGEVQIPDYIHHVGDNNCKFGFESGDTFAIETAGSERLRIDSSGRTLIGHTSSQQSTSMLQVSRANNSIIRVASSDSTATNFAALDLAPANNIAGSRIKSTAVGTFGSTSAETAFLAFETRNAGTTAERLRIHSDGQVTIGNDHAGAGTLSGDLVVAKDSGGLITVSDTGSGEKLHLEGGSGLGRIGTTSNHDLVFVTNGTSNERLRINTSGLLLVGTTADVAGGATNSKIQIRGTSYDASLAITANRTVSGGGNISFSKSRAASQGDATIVQSGDTLGSIVWYGADGTDMNTSAAQLDVQVDTTPGSNDMPGRFVFRTTSDGASSSTERVRIDSSGRVGINRTPALAYSKLEVGGADNYPLINVEASGATGGMGIGSGVLRLYYGTVSRLNITDSTGNVSATNFTTGGYFGSSGPGGGTGIKLQGLAAGSGSSAVDTGISVNRGNAGGTMLVIGSRNTGAGTATQGYVWLLKFQYDGNQLPTEYNIAGTGSFWSLSLSGSNTLQINGNVANWQFGGMWVD